MSYVLQTFMEATDTRVISIQSRLRLFMCLCTDSMKYEDSEKSNYPRDDYLGIEKNIRICILRIT